MATIKRVNLCFNIDREEDRKAYEIIKAKRNKTAFIIEVVLANLKENKSNIDRDELKQIIIEVFKEMNVTSNTVTNKESNHIDDIPDLVLDIISSI